MRAVLVIAALSVVALLSAAVYSLVLPVSPNVLPPSPSAVTLLVAASYPLVGGVLVARQPSNRIGLLFVGIGVLLSLQLWTALYADQGLRAGSQHAHLPGEIAAGWFSGWLATPAIFGAAVILPVIFPSGRAPTGRGRWIYRYDLAAVVLASLTSAFGEGYLGNAWESRQNPVGFLPHSLENVSSVALLGAFVLGVVVLVDRFRGSSGDERLQLKWFNAGAALVAASWIVAWLLYELFGVNDTGFGFAILGVACMPIVTGIAVLRYRLYGIDVLLNRTLVYGVAMGLVVMLDIALVSVLGAVLRQGVTLEISLAATAVVSVLFGPLRRRVQRTVNRLVFGDRDDPSEVVSRLGEQLAQALQPEDVLPAVSNAAASALGVDFVAIDRLDEGRWVRAHERGLPVQPELSVPVTYAADTIGRLVVGGRGALRAGEHGVLSEIARQAGVALHAAGLTDELQRSREQLVHAREEERRRLRRDLHDGLGPTLAAMQLQLRSAELLLTRRDGAGATALLEDVKAETQHAIADIRRLVYALRPPALDDLGLVGALSQQAARFTSSAAGGGEARPLVVTVDAPRLEHLPAAVEVAAYRIALEALTNVSRHAGAGRATVRLTLNGTLEVEVTDDGAGLADDARPSVGLGSMRERAAELGGTCTIDRVPGGGTRVLARLPMPEE